MNATPFRTCFVTSLALIVALCLIPEIASANSDEWIKPATGLIDALRSGLVKIGALVVGLAIVGRGIFMALSGNPDWSKIGIMILGGIFIMAGPTAIAALLETISST